MALGKQIGEFSGQPTSFTFAPGPGNAETYQANMEGTVSGASSSAPLSMKRTAYGSVGISRSSEVPLLFPRAHWAFAFD
jgi:hypothetical protein